MDLTTLSRSVQLIPGRINLGRVNPGGLYYRSPRVGVAGRRPLQAPDGGSRGPHPLLRHHLGLLTLALLISAVILATVRSGYGVLELPHHTTMF